MTESLIVPSPIERGMYNLQSIPECVVEGTPTYDSSARKWSLQVMLQIERAGRFIDDHTRWIIRIDESYPFGKIGFYPAMNGGVTATFPHQARNEVGKEGQRWRTGKLCLDTPFRGELMSADAHDPVGDVDLRLVWHVRRALIWLDAASREMLLGPDDPFELPESPAHSLESLLVVVHDETEDDLGAWQGCEQQHGRVVLGGIPEIEGAICATTFVTRAGLEIRHWMGRSPVSLGQEMKGVWWLWPRPIVISPWYCPGSWGDLRKAGEEAGIDVDSFLKRLARTLRGNASRTLLFLGYPIPTHVGEMPVEVHWDAILLPELSPCSGTPPHGFRDNDRGWWHRDRYGPFSDTEKITYCRTENWSAERLQARGRVSEALRNANIAILGVGALGSRLAEQLVRAGCRRIALFDDDYVEPGNICRHAATLADVYKRKVDTMASRLQQISPIVQVTVYPSDIFSMYDGLDKILEPYDLVIDCTASDDVLLCISTFWWSRPRIFISLSMGYAAARLYSFGIYGHQFPKTEFDSEMGPWLRNERSAWQGREVPYEGAGCWSPLFPARDDDVVMVASVCVKELETVAQERPRVSRFRVFQKHESEQGFLGFSLDYPKMPEDIAS